MNQSKSLEKARSYALRLLKVRLRSEKELIQRMRVKGYSFEDIEKVLSELKGYGLLNDLRFAKFFTSDEVKLRFKGPRYIRYKLRMFGVSDSDISKALEDVMEEIDLKEVFSHFVRSHRSKTQREIKEMLIKRGFDSQTVHETLLAIYEDWRCDNEPRTDACADIRSHSHSNGDNGLPYGKNEGVKRAEKSERKRK